MIVVLGLFFCGIKGRKFLPSVKMFFLLGEFYVPSLRIHVSSLETCVPRLGTQVIGLGT
jgi:hypothetical protein